jgi:hypothetical protein
MKLMTVHEWGPYHQLHRTYDKDPIHELSVVTMSYYKLSLVITNNHKLS